MSHARRVKKALGKWPKCKECGGKLGVCWYANIEQGFLFCCGCGWRVSVDWMGEIMRKAFQVS